MPRVTAGVLRGTAQKSRLLEKDSLAENSAVNGFNVRSRIGRAEAENRR